MPLPRHAFFSPVFDDADEAGRAATMGAPLMRHRTSLSFPPLFWRRAASRNIILHTKLAAFAAAADITMSSCHYAQERHIFIATAYATTTLPAMAAMPLFFILARHAPQRIFAAPPARYIYREKIEMIDDIGQHQVADKLAQSY